MQPSSLLPMSFIGVFEGVPGNHCPYNRQFLPPHDPCMPNPAHAFIPSQREEAHDHPHKRQGANQGQEDKHFTHSCQASLRPEKQMIVMERKILTALFITHPFLQAYSRFAHCGHRHDPPHASGCPKETVISP